MAQYHHKAWHHLIGAAATVLLLIVATALPFGASARDAGGSSGKVGAGTIQDGGARKADPGKRAIPIKPIGKTIAPGDAPRPVRADDPKKKGGKCTPQPCQALKDKCITDSGADEGNRGGRCIIRPGVGNKGETCDVGENARDRCNSISCEGAC